MEWWDINNGVSYYHHLLELRRKKTEDGRQEAEAEALKMMMDRRKPVRNLSESIRSLLGLKANLTSSWVDSVCDIIQSLPSQQSTTHTHSKQDSHKDKGIDSTTIILNLEGIFLFL